MTKHTTVFTSLLRHFSRFDFQSAISGYNADFRARKLSCFDLFKTMLYAFISGCFSVREIEISLRVNKNRIYHSGLKEIKKSTFCDALERKRHDIFKSVFHSITEKAQTIGGRMKKKFSLPLRIIDATVLSVCLARFDWAKYRKAKGAVKLHMNLDGDTLIPYEASITTGKVHDVQQLLNLSQESGVIYVFDRGYVDYKQLYGIELCGSYFVTRMKRNGAYKRVKSNPCKEGGPVLRDELIELTGQNTKKNYPKAMRVIKYYDEEKERIFEFLTNDMSRDAKEVALIYKERWEVELFFKWIKQHLKIKTFWGTSENAVYSQIWVALILQVLLWINKVVDGIQKSSYEILMTIKTVLLTKNSLIGLCTNTPLPKPVNDKSKPFLEGFKC